MQDKAFDSFSSPDVLKQFQLEQLSIEEKSSPDFGKKISQKIWGYVISGLGGYYYNRNARFIKNRNFANGRLDVEQMFKDRFQYNGKQNYIRLVWNTLQIVNRIVSGLVGRWMQRNEMIQVTAIDDLSQTDKEDEYAQVEFIIQNRAQVEQLQQESGVQLIPQGQDIPQDQDELLIWKENFLRTPEEIQQEQGCNDVLKSNGWFDVLKEKMLHDSAEAGLVGTYTWMDEAGVIHVEWLKPENIIYSATDYEDFRDTSWRGHTPSIKISELRKRYGKEFNPNNKLALDEATIWKIAQTAKEYKTVTNLSWQWDGAWTVPFSLRPYDEWNVRSIEFELKTVDSEPYTVTTTKSTKTTYTQKGFPTTPSGKVRNKPNDNQQIVEDTNVNIYRGVYLPDNDILLEWKLKDNMIRPQDPKEAGNAEFSYSFYMYQNWQMRNLAIPEKIEAAIDNMILTCLKMQQVIARMRPTGAAIDETALQNVDFGLGDAGNKAVDKKVLYDQTGDIYYRGVDAEGNRVGVPITELANSGFIGQMEGLIQNYQFWYQTLKDELGEDPNLIQQATQPRVTSQNVQFSQQQAVYATDYMYNAYVECMKMTARKVSCLLKDSIAYGSKAYRSIVKEDISDRVFSTDIKFLPTEQEIARYDEIIQNAIMSNPDLTMFLNQFQAMEMVKQDVKLAWTYYNNCLKKWRSWTIQQNRENQQMTFQGQAQAAQAAEQAKQQTVEMQTNAEMQIKKQEGENQNKNAIINMVAAILSKGLPIDPTVAPLVTATMQNIMIPMVVENEQARQAIIQQMQQAQMAQQQQQQPNQSQQPQEEMAA